WRTGALMGNSGASCHGLNKEFRAIASFVPTYTTSNSGICVSLLNARCSLDLQQRGQQGILRGAHCADSKVQSFERRSTTPLLGRRNIPLALSDKLQFRAEGSGRRPFDIRPTNSEPRIPDDLERTRIDSFSAALRTCPRLRLPTW